MSEDFQKPFTSPPTIFMVATIVGLLLKLIIGGAFILLPMQIILGLPVIAFGVFCIYSSIKDIENAETTYDPYSQSENLVTTGIYKYSRNPGYLGLFFIQIGIGILFDSIWVILLAFLAAYITSKYVIRLEEDKLSKRFGEDYENYRENTRQWV